MTTTTIIQARMASTRLPGKVLLDLAGRSVLSHVIERCAVIEGSDIVCCAVPAEAESDPVAAEAERCGATVFRGSETDVLDRYYRAARHLGADVVLRITSDCPLTDPVVCAAVLKLRADENADFATNNKPPSWPHGLDCEAMTIDWLGRAHREETSAQAREHVTPYIRTHAEARIVNLSAPDRSLLKHRWTLDYPEDIAFFRALHEKMPPSPPIPPLADVVAIFEAHPEIYHINQMHHAVDHNPDSVPAHDAARYAKGKTV